MVRTLLSKGKEWGKKLEREGHAVDGLPEPKG